MILKAVGDVGDAYISAVVRSFLQSSPQMWGNHLPFILVRVAFLTYDLHSKNIWPIKAGIYV